MGALALVLALGSSVVWGTADFAGGTLTRRLPSFAVTLVSQAAGFVVLLVALGWNRQIDGGSFALGLLAGVGGGLGLAAFYRALSLGTMSVVSPIAACGALVPFVLAIAAGERPALFALLGGVAALGGGVLASLEERRADSHERSQAVVLAVAAAVALGVFIYFVGLGSRNGHAISTLVGARIGSLTLLLAVGLATRSPLSIPRASLGAVALVGIADVSANVLFAFATGHGLLALVAVLGSLYPVVTVVLAHVLLGERLTRSQRVGIVVALGGVAAIATA